MYANVSSDAVATAEDTTTLILVHEINFIHSAIERHSNTTSGIVYRWPALLLLFFSIVGVVGNLLVCLAIATERRLQNRTNWFLFSLALADMLVSGLVIPLAVVKEFTGIENNHPIKTSKHDFAVCLGFWILGPFLCGFWIFLDVCSCTSSIMHIVVISIDRYLAINDPLNTRNRQQKCKILLLIILIWLIAILLSSPMIVLGAINKNNIIINGNCLINNDFFVIYGSVISFVIPLVIVIIMYTLTVRRLKEQIRQCQTQLAQEQLARAASLVAKPFLRRHIQTKSAAAAAAAANANSSQSTPLSAYAMRRMRLQRQQTSLELSEESVDNYSLQQQQKQQPQPQPRQFDQDSQIEEQSSISREIIRQPSTKFSPHTEYACPKNPFCQLKCTCDHQHQVQENQPLETVFEPKSQFHCFKHLRCCKTSNTSPSPLRRNPSPKSRPINLLASSNPYQSSTSSKRSIPPNPRTKNWRRLTITPGLGTSRSKSSAVRNEQKAVKVLGVVFAIFVIAWFPFCIMNLLQAVCKRCYDNPSLVNGFSWLGYVSSTINPLVYTIFNRNFRLKFLALLKCHCLYSSSQRQHYSYYQSHSSLHGSRLQRKNGLLQNDLRRFNPFRNELQELTALEPTL